MKNTKLLVQGQVYAVARKLFEDKETVNVQFLNKLESGGVEILQVKLTNEMDSKSIKENSEVQISVKVSQYNGKLFYTQLEPIIKV